MDIILVKKGALVSFHFGMNQLERPLLFMIRGMIKVMGRNVANQWD